MVPEMRGERESLCSISVGCTFFSRKGNYLALGCTAPPALLRFLSEYQKIYQVVLCLDNDDTGVKADAIILETLQRLSEGMYVENLSEEMRGQLRRPYEVSVLKSVKKDGMMI